MNSFKEYDKAIARYHNGLNIKTLPIISWEFNHVFLDELKNNFLDVSRINKMSTQSKWSKNNWDFKNILNDQVIIVTDAKLKIVFASNNIVKMNGYSESEVIGQSPKMFHGKDTCHKTSNEIREAVSMRIPFEKNVLNYKKNGETYQCLIKGFPIFDLKGELSHFIAFEKAA
jgi:PAS domain S-box-containing protein